MEFLAASVPDIGLLQIISFAVLGIAGVYIALKEMFAATHRKELAALKEAHRKELNDSRADHQKEIEEVRQSRNEFLEDLRTRLEVAIVEVTKLREDRMQVALELAATKTKLAYAQKENRQRRSHPEHVDGEDPDS